jgi:hypothetical protein
MGNTTPEDVLEQEPVDIARRTETVATQHGIVDVVVWLPIATAGNLVGGVGLVTLFRLAQDTTKARGSLS